MKYKFTLSYIIIFIIQLIFLFSQSNIMLYKLCVIYWGLGCILNMSIIEETDNEVRGNDT